MEASAGQHNDNEDKNVMGYALPRQENESVHVGPAVRDRWCEGLRHWSGSGDECTNDGGMSGSADGLGVFIVKLCNQFIGREVR
jgi:hypothetical protein